MHLYCTILYIKFIFPKTKTTVNKYIFLNELTREDIYLLFNNSQVLSGHEQQ